MIAKGCKANLSPFLPKFSFNAYRIEAVNLFYYYFYLLKMKNLLLLSFDLIREGEVQKSLAIASLMVYLKKDVRYGHEFEVNHICFNMYEWKNRLSSEALTNCFAKDNVQQYTDIAISCYVWNEYLINPLMEGLRRLGFNGRFILGGYQISYAEKTKLSVEYPLANIFISGYAESSLLKAIFSPNKTVPLFLDEIANFSQIPSAYLENEIPISNGQKMIRWETKRGCPYKCTFCAHRDLKQNRVYKHDLDKAFSELAHFKLLNVKKINILDPVFNAGKDYLSILTEMERIGIEAEVTAQTRFEMIKGEAGEKFLDLAEKLNMKLEFGIQTIIPNEYEIIKRPNDKHQIQKLMSLLNERQIDYEISLIYGLPQQTLSSFQESLDFVQKNGGTNIKAFPLLLLKGTELYNEKEKWSLKEKVLGDFDIPTVVESATFKEEEWHKMDLIAQQLDSANRIR